jgi:hypothetical protein
MVAGCCALCFRFGLATRARRKLPVRLGLAVGALELLYNPQLILICNIHLFGSSRREAYPVGMVIPKTRSNRLYDFIGRPMPALIRARRSYSIPSGLGGLQSSRYPALLNAFRH